MNSAFTEEQTTQAKEGPGARLRALREVQDMDLQRAASLLHLSNEKLEALEADDYERLGGSVFVQGYLRNYARLLGIPVEPLINAYRKNTHEQVRLPELRVTQLRHEVRSSHTAVRLVTWFIVIGLIALVVVWWRGYLQWPLKTEIMESGTPAAVAEGDLPIFEQQQEESSIVDSTTRLPEIDEQGEAALLLPAKASEADPGEPLSPEPVDPPASESLDSSALPGSSQRTATEVSIPLEAPPQQIEAEDEPAVPSGTSGVVIEFVGTSWTKIRDSSGSFRIMGEIKEGTRRELQGTPPYSIVLGNAQAAIITIDGEPFDITPHIRGNVARFSLDPDR